MARLLERLCLPLVQSHERPCGDTFDSVTCSQIDSFLTDQGYGTLSFARGGESYGVPVSFGYNVEVGSAGRAWSPAGRCGRSPTDPMTDVNHVELRIREATGRKGQAYQE